jgi:hypothetical protein
MGDLLNLSTEEFVELVADVGEIPDKWFTYMGKCPRPHVDARFGQVANDPSCPLCGGTTQLYVDTPIPVNGLTGGMIVFQRAFAGRRPIAGMEGAVAQATYLDTDYPLMERDRFVLASRENHFTEKPGRRVNGMDLLRYYPVSSIMAIYDPNGLVDPALYQVNTARTAVEWLDLNTAPLPGAYTVRYSYLLSLVVMDGSIHRRVRAENGDQFPNTCQLKQWQYEPTEIQAGQP